MRNVTLPLCALLLFTTAASAAETEGDPLPGGAAPTDGTRKVAAIEVTPLGLFLGHYGAQLDVVPAPHHGIVLSGYYAHAESVDALFPDYTKGGPTNVYDGGGGELGYRYYFGALGPHGLYIGPSLLLGAMSADLATTTTARTHYAWHHVGGAIDVGYQSIVGPVLFGLGAGVQYVHVDRDIPSMGDLTDIMTRSAVRPRVAVTFGYAF